MSDHHYILCIETATTVCSVALFDKGGEVCRKEANEANVHASALTVFINEVIQTAQISLRDLSAVAVGKGPGSYTGLRIGVSVAKGICYALDIPLIAVDTLRAMASGFIHSDHDVWGGRDAVFCPMIDARRLEVYTTVLDGHLSVLEKTRALIVDANTFDTWVNSGCDVVLFGNGADKFAEMFDHHETIHVVPGFQNSAAFMMGPVLEKFHRGEFEDVAYFEPFYLKDFVATTPKKLV